MSDQAQHFEQQQTSQAQPFEQQIPQTQPFEQQTQPFGSTSDVNASFREEGPTTQVIEAMDTDPKAQGESKVCLKIFLNPIFYFYSNNYHRMKTRKKALTT